MAVVQVIELKAGRILSPVVERTAVVEMNLETGIIGRKAFQNAVAASVKKLEKQAYSLEDGDSRLHKTSEELMREYSVEETVSEGT